jgi:DNA modification methylase
MRKKVNIKEIVANKENPRYISDKKFNKLVQSIKDFPEMLDKRPLIVDEDMVVLGGNMRLKALQKAGIKEIPIDIAVGWTDEQKNEFIIKDNVGFGEWDFDILANEWDIDKLNEWGLDFDFKIETEVEEDDYVEPDDIKVDVVLGDFIEIGEHKLLCGDCLISDNAVKIFKDLKADLLLTDPPYNVDYTGKTKKNLKIKNDKMDDKSFYEFLYDFFTTTKLYIKEGGSVYVWHADTEGHNFRKAFVDSGFLLKQCLIWVKNQIVMGRQDYHWQHEPCLYGWNDGAAHNWYSDRKQSTVLNFDKPSRNESHPTMKPIDLISYQIRNSTKKGDIIYDPFIGSGSTMLAAHQLNRICYGIELDPKYCQVIIDRMLNFDSDITVKINGKKYKSA